jgi:hypothetical protein
MSPMCPDHTRLVANIHVEQTANSGASLTCFRPLT